MDCGKPLDGEAGLPSSDYSTRSTAGCGCSLRYSTQAGLMHG